MTLSEFIFVHFLIFNLSLFGLGAGRVNIELAEDIHWFIQISSAPPRNRRIPVRRYTNIVFAILAIKFELASQMDR